MWLQAMFTLLIYNLLHAHALKFRSFQYCRLIVSHHMYYFLRKALSHIYSSREVNLKPSIAFVLP